MSDKDKDQELETTADDLESANGSLDEKPLDEKPLGEEPLDEETPAEPPAEENAAATDDGAAGTGDSGSPRSGDVPLAVTPEKRRGNGIAWLALLLSVCAVGAIGYTLSQEWLAKEDTSTDDALAGLENRLAAGSKSHDELAAEVAALGALDQTSNTRIDELQQELDERVRLLSSLPARMTTLEGSVASLAGISQSSRDAWLIAEAEYYMQIANAQLQLANNPELAALALRMADERVVQMSNPALMDVRRAISDELAALDVMEKPDVAGATMTLASLAQVVEALPLASEASSPDDSAASTDDEQSGLNRAWSSMKKAMSGLVRVTPPDQAKLELVSPDAEMFLRNNLALQLQSARLALLRGEQAVFEQSLDDTGALLSQYFDGESAQVQSAMETLAEVRGNVFTSSAPDISRSLQLLRQFRTLRESSQ